MTDTKELDRLDKLVAEAMGLQCTSPFRDGKTCRYCQFTPTRNAADRDTVIEWLWADGGMLVLDDVSCKSHETNEISQFSVGIYSWRGKIASADGHETYGELLCRAVEELMGSRKYLAKETEQYD